MAAKKAVPAKKTAQPEMPPKNMPPKKGAKMPMKKSGSGSSNYC